MVLLGRVEAGCRLAEKLMNRQWRSPSVLVIPPGGVWVGWEIVKQLIAPMDVISALEVIVPGTRCLRIGAVSEGVFVAGTARSSSGNRGDVDYVRRLVAIDVQRQARLDSAYRGDQARLILGTEMSFWWTTGGRPDMILAMLHSIQRRGALSVTLATPQCQTETSARMASAVHLVSLLPRAASRSILLIDESLYQVTPEETAELIRISRRPSVSQVEPLMNAMPGLSAASQASRVA